MEPLERGLDDKRSLPSVVGALAASIDRALSPGDVAALRRLRPNDPDCGAYWRLLGVHLHGNLPSGGEVRDDAERRWAVILQALATMEGLHRPGTGCGRALALAGFSELRLLRLLRAHSESLADAVRVTARFLANAAVGANHTDIAALVLSDGGPSAEAVRRRIARDYYWHVEREH